MNNTQTFGGIKQIVATFVDEIVSSNMFTDTLWAEVLNEWMSYIYGYHKWSWNVVDTTKTITNSKTIELDYPIQEVILLEINWNKYTQAQYYLDAWTQQFLIDWNIIKLPDNTTGDVRVVYRKWFNEYLPTDVNRKLDIPFWLNSVLVNLMQFRILPIWLWEWAGWLMNNYLQDAIQQLERYKVIDTYAEAQRNLIANRK